MTHSSRLAANQGSSRLHKPADGKASDNMRAAYVPSYCQADRRPKQRNDAGACIACAHAARLRREKEQCRGNRTHGRAGSRAGTCAVCLRAARAHGVWIVCVHAARSCCEKGQWRGNHAHSRAGSRAGTRIVCRLPSCRAVAPRKIHDGKRGHFCVGTGVRHACF